MLVAFLLTDTVIEPSSCLVVLVSRKVMEPSDSVSIVDEFHVDDVDEFHSHLNSINPHIKFTK